MTAPSRTDEFLWWLHAEHMPAVLAFVTNLTRDRVLAEDVLQETAIRAWRNMERLERDRTSVRSWLYRVARNVAIDKFRARRARPVEVREFDQDVAVHDHADQVVATMTVHTALATMHDPYVAVLRECYLNGRTVVETADVLGIPVGTAKSRLYRAIRDMRQALTD